MRNFRACLIAFSAITLFQTSPAFAQTTPSASTPTPVVQQRAANPALWVVKDEDTTIYLFGTVHLLPDGINWNQGAIKTAFDEAGTLRLEIANMEAEGPAVQAIVAARGIFPAGQTLSDSLTVAQKIKLERIAGEAGIHLEALNRVRPWLASIMLAVNMYQKMGLDPNKGVDKALEGLAKMQNTPVEGFETGVEQIGFLSGLSPVQEQQMLLSTLDDWDQGKTILDTMVNAWARGDANTVGRLLSTSIRSQPELGRVFLTDRNSRWADWVAGRMAQPGTVFVAVGAGHLAGRDSVQAFLRKKGLRAQRVANPASR